MISLQVFEKGKRYKFSKEVYDKVEDSEMDRRYNWAQDCNDREVEFEEDAFESHNIEVMGKIRYHTTEFCILPQWCVEIPIENKENAVREEKEEQKDE